jgi:hypothetical protein
MVNEVQMLRQEDVHGIVRRKEMWKWIWMGTMMRSLRQRLRHWMRQKGLITVVSGFILSDS